MAKCKQPEAYIVEPNSTVVEGRDASQGKETTGSKKAVVENRLSPSWTTGEVTGDPGAGSSIPVATAC